MKAINLFQRLLAYATEPSVLRRYPYQREVLRAFASGKPRVFCLLWERQAGKSTALADLSLYEMMARPHRTCVYAEEKLLGGEIQALALFEDQLASQQQGGGGEAAALQRATAGYQQFAQQAGKSFRLADARENKVLDLVRPDDFAQLFVDQRLEFRVYHDDTSYSRTKIIAPNVATARSWSGTVFLDEVAFIDNFHELMIGVEPIISSDPDFKLVMSTTPPECNDLHYSYHLLAPPPGHEFKPNACGNWYESSEGHIQVHRTDARDSHLAGKKIYDKNTGKTIAPEEALNRASNRQGYLVSHMLAWLPGGNAACDLLALRAAQQRGVGPPYGTPCRFFLLEDHVPGDVLQWLGKHLDPNATIALGLDVGTTAKRESNPTVLAVAESKSPDTVIRAIFAWKTPWPQVSCDIVERILLQIVRRPRGGFPRAMAVDATNEKYFCKQLQERFGYSLSIHPVVANESYQGPHMVSSCAYKEFLGETYVAMLQDNRITLPPDEYVRLDHRLVSKERGRFVCQSDAEGRHGDTFDACKLAVYALHYTPIFWSCTI